MNRKLTGITALLLALTLAFSGCSQSAPSGRTAEEEEETTRRSRRTREETEEETER